VSVEGDTTTTTTMMLMMMIIIMSLNNGETESTSPLFSSRAATKFILPNIIQLFLTTINKNYWPFSPGKF
jgi:hypothetical protein